MRFAVRFIMSALRPVDTVLVSLLIDFSAIAIPTAVAVWLKAHGALIAVAVLTGFVGLLLWAGIRLQRRYDRPLNLAIYRASFIINEKHITFDDEQGVQLTAPVFGISAQFVNHGNRAVSAAFSLRFRGVTIDGDHYDDLLRWQEDGSVLGVWQVLPQSLHNPLHLAAVGDDRSNRKGVIGFDLTDEQFKQIGSNLHDLNAGELVVTDRFSESREKQTFRLADLAQEAIRS